MVLSIQKNEVPFMVMERDGYSTVVGIVKKRDKVVL